MRVARAEVMETLVEMGRPGLVRPKKGRAEVAINPELKQEQQDELRQLMDKHRQAFRNSVDEVGVAQNRWVVIDLIDKNPVTSGKSRRIPLHKRQVVWNHIQELYKPGAIEPSRSPYCSGVVCVFKDLNARTTDDGYQLPLVEDQLAVLTGSQWFTKLDMYQRYPQLWLAPEAKAKTAFNVEGEHWQYTVLPFGLKNGSAAFARFVFEIVGDLQRNGRPVAEFFEDIFIGGNTWQEHVGLVTEVFSRLEKSDGVVKAAKAQLGMTSIECLGVLVGRGSDRIRRKWRQIKASRDRRPRKSLEDFQGC